MGNTIIRRTTLIVRDIQRSSQWYQDVLEMSPYYDDEITLSGVGLAAGQRGDKTHLMILKCQDPTIGMIGLLQWIEPSWPAPTPPPTAVTYGAPIFVVETDDVRGLYERAQTHETHIHSELHEWSVRGPSGEMLNFLGMSMFDPDGHFFEVNQRLS